MSCKAQITRNIFPYLVNARSQNSLIFFSRSVKGEGAASRAKVRIDIGESEEYTYDDQNDNQGQCYELSF